MSHAGLRDSQLRSMNRNVELKVRYDDLAAAQRVAQRLGAVLAGAERQLDTYFQCQNGRLKLRQRWLESPGRRVSRSRAAPLAELIWYCRSDSKRPRPSDYSIIAIDDGARCRQMLCDALGMLLEIDKHRTIYLHDNVRIHLDRVKHLGNFIEFEAIVDHTCTTAQARAKVARLQQAFERQDQQIVAVSYSDLLAGG